MKEIVDINKPCDYKAIENYLELLKKRYEFLNCFSIGKSVLQRELFCVTIGDGDNLVLYNAAHHSLEWITALFLMKAIEKICFSYSKDERLMGYDVKKIFKKSKLFFVPMVNPDGVELVINGMKKDNPNYDKLILYNGGSTNFKTKWQANANGVDLNHNYDALFDLSKKSEKEYGIKGPGPTRFSGNRPFSEPETKSLAYFTSIHDFNIVTAYHSQGEVIYYSFNNKEPKISLKLAKLIADEIGYTIDKPLGMASYGGYKDWFIDRFKKPAFTIEVGRGVNPLPLSSFNSILDKNLKGLLLISLL